LLRSIISKKDQLLLGLEEQEVEYVKK
jgi:hypothetical protein